VVYTSGVTALPPGSSHPARRSLLAWGGAAALSATSLAAAGSARASTGPGSGGWSATPTAPVLRPRPLHIHGLGSSRQVVIVTTTGWREIHGTIEAWELGDDGTWRIVMSPYNANIGINGWVVGDQRIQGDHKTPVGVYSMHKAFGRSADPGSGLPYTQLTPSNYWAGDQLDPKTYNIFQASRPPTARWRTSQSEHLYYITPAYQYLAAIDYNLAGGVHRQADGQNVAVTPANTRLGSAIFLHCYGTTGPYGYTLGCVNTHPAKIAWLLRWFDPAKAPVIAMGPPSALYG
jgi:L,D-peptidoglycan transpeptidase YkuD (ErfK/YbiS/YcfS/YnhG family)